MDTDLSTLQVPEEAPPGQQSEPSAGGASVDPVMEPQDAPQHMPLEGTDFSQSQRVAEAAVSPGPADQLAAGARPITSARNVRCVELLVVRATAACSAAMPACPGAQLQ